MSKWKTKDPKVNYRVFQMIPEKGKNIGDEKFFAGTRSHTVTQLCQADFVVVFVVVCFMNVIVVALFVVFGNIIFSCCQ